MGYFTVHGILPRLLPGITAIMLGACSSSSIDRPVEDPPASTSAITVDASDGTALSATVLSSFDNPWAMTFLPDGQALVTEKGGRIWLLDVSGRQAGEIGNVPSVVARGQGGLGDIIVSRDFADDGTVYLSYVERDANDDTLSGAVVERATLTLSEGGGELTDRSILWRQTPKVTGNGHYSHRLAVSDDDYLFITSGERQKFSPAQNMDTNLGKLIRLNLDGTTPEDNPFHGNGDVANQVWTLGHRNPLGIDFDSEGQLWAHEMGPKGGDELNRIVRAENYGYPLVSNGDHYSGVPIPSHDSNPAFENPALWWDPVISPAGFVIYDGEMFDDWSGDGFIGGLSSEALVRVEFQQAPEDNTGADPSDDRLETTALEAARYEWGKRIREVEQAPDGAILVLEDGDGGRLVRLAPER